MPETADKPCSQALITSEMAHCCAGPCHWPCHGVSFSFDVRRVSCCGFQRPIMGLLSCVSKAFMPSRGVAAAPGSSGGLASHTVGFNQPAQTAPERVGAVKQANPSGAAPAGDCSHMPGVTPIHRFLASEFDKLLAPLCLWSGGPLHQQCHIVTVRVWVAVIDLLAGSRPPVSVPRAGSAS